MEIKVVAEDGQAYLIIRKDTSIRTRVLIEKNIDLIARRLYNSGKYNFRPFLGMAVGYVAMRKEVR